MNDNQSPRKNENIFEKFRGWRLNMSIDSEALIKGIVIGILLVFFSLLETTLFTRFKPFGAVPDLILPLVIAVAMSEREKWGAIFGVVAAFVIESLGGSSLTLLPILYMPVGYIVGILNVHYFRDSFATRALYTVVTSAARSIFTLIALFATTDGVRFVTAIVYVMLPEILCNIIFAAIPHLFAIAALAPFHKSRDARVKTKDN
ncbi:MAG: hypothetical protein E7672_07735 [Ruminococcaceae bacterium]|nr:hypothetical protein [Oscillospiraceae bacterium]